MEKVSIVIVSDERLAPNVTRNCLISLVPEHVSEIIVVESDRKTNHDNSVSYLKGKVITVYPPEDEPFNYNKYLNIGFEFTTSKYITFCNNDLVFTKLWWINMRNEIHKDGLKSLSPICPNSHKEYGFKISNEIITGTQVRRIIAGWCIVIERELYQSIGGFNESYSFWCADNVFGKQLEKQGELHALVMSSVVYHLESQSLKNLDDTTHDEFTRKQVMKFNNDFNENIFNLR